MELHIIVTFLCTWVFAWKIFRRRHRLNVLIEQSPNLNGKIEVHCDSLPNESVRIRIKDKLTVS